MKIITKTDAESFLKKDAEASMVMEIIDPGRQFAYLKVLEQKESELELCRYAKGAGWLTTPEIMADREGATLRDKLASEQGYHTGNMHYDDEDAIRQYITNDHSDDDYIFILGTDKEIQMFLPYLSHGSYCFCFETEDAVKERHYRDRQREYWIADASFHIETYVEDERATHGDKAADELEIFFNDRIEIMVDLFEKRQDCDIDINSTWDYIVNEFYKKFNKSKL